MSKYGKIENGAPDITQDIAALNDLLGKGEITSSEFNKKKDKLIKDKLMYIARTNGAYTVSKKTMKEYNKMVLSINDSKKVQEGMKQQQNRDQFLAEIKKVQEETPSE